MDIHDAASLAHEIMAEHLVGWGFEFDRAKRRFGRCSFRTRLITLSAPLVLLNERERVEDTIRHEVAHAIAGARAGHGPLWKEACYVTGARPERCYDSKEVETPMAPWRVECPSGHFSYPRYRRKKNAACARCLSPVIYVRNTDIGSN
jgi:predicted SprT family Zn-dependent metalloprotease